MRSALSFGIFSTMCMDIKALQLSTEIDWTVASLGWDSIEDNDSAVSGETQMWDEVSSWGWLAETEADAEGGKKLLAETEADAQIDIDSLDLSAIKTAVESAINAATSDDS